MYSCMKYKKFIISYISISPFFLKKINNICNTYKVYLINCIMIYGTSMVRPNFVLILNIVSKLNSCRLYLFMLTNK